MNVVSSSSDVEAVAFAPFFAGAATTRLTGAGAPFIPPRVGVGWRASQPFQYSLSWSCGSGLSESLSGSFGSGGTGYS